jgi:hypothetical protein
MSSCMQLIAPLTWYISGIVPVLVFPQREYLGPDSSRLSLKRFVGPDPYYFHWRWRAKALEGQRS